MRVLLANAPAILKLPNGKEKFFIRAGSRWPFSVVKERHQPLEDYIPFPFYLAYATALCKLASKQMDLDVHAVDAIALNWSQDSFLHYINRLRPDVLFLESTTPTVELDADTASKIKALLPNVIICIGGSHVTALPRETLERFPMFDFGFRGEYEFAFLNFLQSWSQHPNDRSRLNQVCYFYDGQFRDAPKALIPNLDSLPFPAWEEFPIRGENPWSYYWDHICQRKPAAQMHASRGCPFRCDYCVWIQVMYDSSKFRAFSPKRVIAEMKELQRRYGVREIYFDDDIFTGHKGHVIELCKEIKSADLGIQWSIMGDAMICDEEMLEAMAGAGMIAMKFGVESGDERVLKAIQKPILLEKVRRLCTRANTLGIKTHATFSFGLSGETRASMDATLRAMKSIDVDTLQVSITTPFPGTRFYEKAKAQGLLTSDDWSAFDGANSAVIQRPDLSAKELEEFARGARRRWLRSRLVHPAWLLRQAKRCATILRYQGPAGLLRLIRAGIQVLNGAEVPSSAKASKSAKADAA